MYEYLFFVLKFNTGDLSKAAKKSFTSQPSPGKSGKNGDVISDYEISRLKNLEENRRMLDKIRKKQVISTLREFLLCTMY